MRRLLLACAALAMAASAASQPLPDDIRSAGVTVQEYNEEIETIRALARARGADARNALARLFAERSWGAMQQGDYPLAARYALAGWRFAPAREGEYAALLGRIMHETPESRVLRVGFDLFDAVISPDGRKLVTFGRNREAVVWDIDGEREITRLTGHEAWLSSAAFSPDSRQIVTSAEDDTVRLWSAETGDEIRRWEGETVAGEVWFSSDGGSVFAAGFWLRGEAGAHRYEIARFNAVTGAAEESLERRSIFGASSDGRRTVRSPGGRRYTEFELLDATGAVVAILSHGEHSARRAVFSPNSRHVATWGTSGPVWIWDAETGAPVTTLSRHGDNIAGANAEDREIFGVAFSPDSQRIATASADRTARIWDAQSGEQRAVLRGHTDFVTEARFTPDGQRIVTASSDGAARIWHAEPDRLEATLAGHEGGINAIAFSPDGARLLTGGGDGRALLWDVAGQREYGRLDQHAYRISRVGFSPDGRFALTAGGLTVRVWDVTHAPHQVAQFENIRGAIGPFVFSPDGSRLAVGVSNGQGEPQPAPLWDVESWTQIGASQGDLGQPHSVFFRGRDAYAAIFSGLTISIGPLDGSPAVERIRDPDSVGFLFGSISGDGARLVDDDGRLWDVESGRLIIDANFFRPGVVFSADNRHVLMVPRSPLDGALNVGHLFDARNGELRAVLRADAGDMLVATFSADGARIAASFADGSLRVFDAASGREMAAFAGSRGSAVAIQFSPDGALLASGGSDRLIRLWDTRRLAQPMSQLARDACASLLSPNTRIFSDIEIGADPLIREVWLRGGREHRDVCEGVAGAPPLAN
ncbi:MAG: hypothetical protein A4S17_03570 [Proteobacteria bacterium HN_bin10]|nr:MAG: hypothetical protein A4S17_03570 [Proteobacteria bacterium HN_bin10]